jgi:ClpP class serine protease
VAQLGRSFALTEALLAERRSGVVLLLDRGAIGRSWRLSAERPTGFDVVRAFGDDDMGGGPELAASGTGVAVVRAIGCIQQRSEYVECGGGYIDGYDALTERFCEAHEAEEAGAVVLVLDGPGGDAAGCEQGVLRMLAAARASGKPTLVYVDELAASAHYWIAAVLGTGGVFLPPSGRVGSIGCMSWHTDYSGANALAGEVVTYFSSPAGKVAGNCDEPLSDLARARRQASVDELAAPFFAAVAASRGLALDAVIALDGAVLGAAAAIAAGLADGLETFEAVIALAAARAVPIAPPSPSISPAGAPNPAPAAHAAAKGSSVKLSHQLLALLPGLAADASDAAVEAAVLPRLGALRDGMTAAGDANTSTFAGTVKALAADAARLPDLLAAQAALTAVSEAAARIALLELAVRTGKLAPADAWSWSEDGKIRSVAPDYGPRVGDVGMSLQALEGFLSRKAVTSPAGTKAVIGKEPTASEIANAAALTALTPAQVQFAGAQGVDPVKFAALHASNFGARAAAES